MRPLEGITVIDFSQAYSGPYCAMNLADYGARVIKVERVDGGDQSRSWHPYASNGNSGYFAVYNRNKEGIAVDLNKPEGKEIIKRLYRKTDVVLENFKYGTLDKLGVGYEEMKKANPEIIFASITGFGQTGPLRTNTAYDNVIECMCGFMEMTGFPDDMPLRSGASVGDSYTGLMMAFAIVLACYDKRRTGRGKRIDVSMLDTMFAAIEDAILAYSLTGTQISRTGNAKPREIVPYDTYFCADGFIATGINDETMWPDFCAAIGRPDLKEDPRYSTNDLRCENFESFTELMKEIFAEKTEEEIFRDFAEFNIPVSASFDPLDAIEHPQIKARDMSIEFEDANVGHLRTFGFPVKFSKTPGCIMKSSPRLGENTRDILMEVGFSSEEIDRLAADKVISISEGGVL